MIGWSPDIEGMSRRMGYENKDNWGEFKSILPTAGEIVSFGIGMSMIDKAVGGLFDGGNDIPRSHNPDKGRSFYFGDDDDYDSW